jgi:predicted amidohydrolase
MIGDIELTMVQMRSRIGDIHGNTEKMLRFIGGCASDIICFPELSMTGYDSGESYKYGMRADDEHIIRIQKASNESDTIVVFGFPELSPEGVYITQAVAFPDGKMETYRKTHLGRFEKEHFMQGDSFLCADSDKASIGIELCWESHIPEISSCLRAMGADIVLIPHASFMGPELRLERWKRYLPARAYDNRIFAAACNAVGDGNGGGILILDPDGKVLAEHASGEECAVGCVLDAKLLRREPQDKGMSMRGTDFFAAKRPELYNSIK